MFDLIAAVEQMNNQNAAVPERLKILANSPQSEETIAQVLADLIHLVDWGQPGVAYEYAEIFEKKWRTLVVAKGEISSSLPRYHPVVALQICRMYIIHWDLARGRCLAQAQPQLEALVANPLNDFIHAHALSALGFLAFLQQKNTLAKDRFNQARELFLADGDLVDALKMQVREIMVLRFEDQQEEAFQRAEMLLAESLPHGVAAISPILLAYSILGQASLALGRRFEALRYLKESARLARVMPPSNASAYAMFQYGRALQEHGKHEEAVRWLEKAATVQRVSDPVAHFATLIHLVRSHRLSENWSDARTTARALINQRITDNDAQAAREMFAEVHRVFLETLDFARAGRVVERAAEWSRLQEESEENSALIARLSDETNTQVATWECACSRIPACSELTVNDQTPILFMDLVDERIVFHQVCGSLALLRIDSNSAMSALLVDLFQALLRGEAGIHRGEIINRMANSSPGVQEKSLRKKLLRIMDPLTNAGILVEESTGVIGFPSSCRVAIRNVRSPANLIEQTRD